MVATAVVGAAPIVALASSPVRIWEGRDAALAASPPALQRAEQGTPYAQGCIMPYVAPLNAARTAQARCPYLLDLATIWKVGYPLGSIAWVFRLRVALPRLES
jgi:hypothetical protein